MKIRDTNVRRVLIARRSKALKKSESAINRKASRDVEAGYDPDPAIDNAGAPDAWLQNLPESLVGDE